MINILNSFRSILVNAGMIVIGRVIGAVISMILYYFIAKYYGPEMVGLIGLVGSIAILIGMVGTLGFHISILRFIPEYEVKHSKKDSYLIFDYILIVVATFSIILSVLFFIFNNLFINILENQFIKQNYIIILISALIVIKPISMLLNSALRAFSFNKFFALYQFFTPLTNLIFFFIFLSFLPLSSPLFALLISFILPSIVAWLVIKYHFFNNKYHTKNKSINASNEIPITLKTSIPILMAAYAGIIASEAGIIILSTTSSQNELGLYVIALKISLLSSLAMKALNAILAPKVSYLFNLDKIDDMFVLSRFITFISTTVSLFVIIIFYFFGQALIQIIFGESFEGAYIILLVLLIAQLVNSSTGSKGELLQMTGDEIKYRNITYIGAVMYLISNFLLVPVLGGVGAALSLVIAELTWSLLSLIAIHKRFRRLPLIKISELHLTIKSIKTP